MLTDEFVERFDSLSERDDWGGRFADLISTGFPPSDRLQTGIC